MKVRNFNYGGFFVEVKKGYAKFTAEFIEWTEDPGIFLAKCSDGKERRIPSCCVDINEIPPEQKWK